MPERNAIVIGAGIGGLATAAGLSRNGWRVTVFEQAPQLNAVGAGITLAPNAVRALDWLGAGVALRKRSMASGAAGLRTATGRWLLRTTVDQLTARQGLPVYALHAAIFIGCCSMQQVAQICVSVGVLATSELTLRVRISWWLPTACTAKPEAHCSPTTPGPRTPVT